MWIALPEAHACRKVPWNLFVVLTFRHEHTPRSRWESLFRNWIHRVAKDLLHIKHPESLRFVVRYEVGKLGHGHLHICIADIPDAMNTVSFRHASASQWYKLTGANAHVHRYDRGRDGIGYTLKRPLPPLNREWAAWDEARADKDDDAPLLSKSLLRHRCRTHFGRKASRTQPVSELERSIAGPTH